MAAEDDVNRVFREFARYTGDGLPGEPLNAPLPVGDPQSGVHNIKKAEMRSLFALFSDPSAYVLREGGSYTGDVSFDALLNIGNDIGSSRINVGDDGAAIGREPVTGTVRTTNPSAGFDWTTENGVVATMDPRGFFEAQAIASRRDTYGTFENATTSWVMGNPRTGNDGRPAVLGFTSPSQVATYWDRDSVGLYVDNYGRNNLAGVPNCTFTATRVTMGITLGPEQVAALRVGMLIDTLHTPQKYTGTITAWDLNGTWIDVSGWFLVMQYGGGAAGNTAAGQVPSGPQGVHINPQTKTWALNANTFVDGDSNNGTMTIAELGFFNNRAAFDYSNALTHSYGVDVVSIGSHSTGWGFTARSAVSQIWIGMETFGMSYAGFVAGTDRWSGANPKYGFLARGSGGIAFGVVSEADIPYGSWDNTDGVLQVGTVGPTNKAFDRLGNSLAGTRNGVQISGAAPAGHPQVQSFGVDTDINLLVTAKGAGVVSLAAAGNKLNFFGGANALKQTVTGAKGGNAALASLLAALAGYGLITDSTSA